MAYCEMQGGWLDLTERKLIALPPELRVKLANGPKSKDFKMLTRKDMRVAGRAPVDLE